MHAQLRISTTTKDTKSTKLARPVEADSGPNTADCRQASCCSG